MTSEGSVEFKDSALLGAQQFPLKSDMKVLPPYCE
jgi:hypothetical protein